MYNNFYNCSSDRRPHVALVHIWRLINAKGGMSKVFCDMANALASRGFEVSAICYDENKGVPGYHIDPTVQFINTYDGFKHTFLDSKIAIKIRSWSPSKKQRKLKRFSLKYVKQQNGIGKALDHIKNVDIFISFQSETTFILRQLLEIKAPIVTMLHGRPSCYWNSSSFPLYKTAIEESDVIQVLRPEFVKEARLYVKKTPIVVISNVAPQYKECANLQKKENHHSWPSRSTKRPRTSGSCLCSIERSISRLDLRMVGRNICRSNLNKTNPRVRGNRGT